VWRVTDRANIELTTERAAKGYKRLPPKLGAKVASTVMAIPGRHGRRWHARRASIDGNIQADVLWPVCSQAKCWGEEPDRSPVRDV